MHVWRHGHTTPAANLQETTHALCAPQAKSTSLAETSPEHLYPPHKTLARLAIAARANFSIVDHQIRARTRSSAMHVQPARVIWWTVHIPTHARLLSLDRNQIPESKCPDPRIGAWLHRHRSPVPVRALCKGSHQHCDFQGKP